MVSKIGTSIILAAAFFGASMRLPTASCILSNAPAEKACTPGCCANKTCCITSPNNTGPPVQLLAKSGSDQQNIATPPSAVAMAVLNPFSPAQSGPRIRRRRSRSSAFVSSDPKSLTPEVCPITGTSRVQTLFRTDENTLPTILLFSFSFNRQTKSHQRCSCVFAEHVCLGCRHARASQAAFLRRRNDGHAGKR